MQYACRSDDLLLFDNEIVFKANGKRKFFFKCSAAQFIYIMLFRSFVPAEFISKINRHTLDCHIIN